MAARRPHQGSSQLIVPPRPRQRRRIGENGAQEREGRPSLADGIGDEEVEEGIAVERPGKRCDGVGLLRGLQAIDLPGLKAGRRRAHRTLSLEITSTHGAGVPDIAGSFGRKSVCDEDTSSCNPRLHDARRMVGVEVTIEDDYIGPESGASRPRSDSCRPA